jgi:hypothetical protein
MRSAFELGHVDDETVLHLLLEQALVGFVDNVTCARDNDQLFRLTGELVSLFTESAATKRGSVRPSW